MIEQSEAAEKKAVTFTGRPLAGRLFNEIVCGLLEITKSDPFTLMSPVAGGASNSRINCCEYVFVAGLQADCVPGVIDRKLHPPTVHPISVNIPETIGPGLWFASAEPINGVMREFTFPAGYVPSLR